MQVEATARRIAEMTLRLNPQREFEIEVAEEMRQPLIEAFEAAGCMVKTDPTRMRFTVIRSRSEAIPRQSY